MTRACMYVCFECVCVSALNVCARVCVCVCVRAVCSVSVLSVCVLSVLSACVRACARVCVCVCDSYKDVVMNSIVSLDTAAGERPGTFVRDGNVVVGLVATTTTPPPPPPSLTT